MPEPIDIEKKATPEKTPDEGERAKARFTQTLSAELQRSLHFEKKQSQALATFIGNRTVDRLVERSGIKPEEMAEFFEGLPAMTDVRAFIDKKGKYDVFVGSAKTVPLSPEHQQLAFQEIVRAQLLCRAADIDFRGTSFKEGPTRLQEAFLLNDWVATYEGLGHQSDNKSGLAHGKPFTEIHFQTPPKIDQLSEACERDPELFSDLMIAFGVREGGGSADGVSFNQAWKQIDPSYQEYGLEIARSEAEIPYRPGKRQEDVKLVLEKAKTFGEGGAKVKTYQDLEGDMQSLKRENMTLTEQVGDLQQSQTELHARAEEQESQRKLAELDAHGAKQELAREREARESAEATVAALQQRMKEMLTVAEEKVGLLSKDNRVERMRNIIEGSASKGKK